MFVKPGMPKYLVLTSEDGATFQSVGLFAFRDPENLPQDCKEGNDPAFIERGKRKKCPVRPRYRASAVTFPLTGVGAPWATSTLTPPLTNFRLGNHSNGVKGRAELKVIRAEHIETSISKKSPNYIQIFRLNEMLEDLLCPGPKIGSRNCGVCRSGCVDLWRN